MAAQRIKSKIQGRIWEFGEFKLEEIQRRLTKNGESVTISGKPLDLLICLLASETPIVEKDYIVKHAWPETSVVESVVKVTIGTLRKILGDESKPSS